MMATGIIRRTDDLGRVVIPKEVRKSMNIHSGDPLEIYIDKENNGIVFIPYEHITFTKRINDIMNDIDDEIFYQGNNKKYAKTLKLLNDVLKELEGK